MIFFNWHNYIFLKSEQMFGRKEVKYDSTKQQFIYDTN